MKLKLMAGAAVVAFLAASGAARAQDSGWYTAVDLGYDNPGSLKATTSAQISQNQIVDVDPVAATSVSLSQTKGLRYRFNSDNSWLGFARLGYRVAPNWRVELEVGGHQNDIKFVGGSGSTNTGNGYNSVSRGIAAGSACVGCIALTQGGGTIPTPVGTGVVAAPGGVPGSPVYGFDLSQLNNIQGGSQTYTAMVNVLYDFAPDQIIQPFIGFGIGMGYTKWDVSGVFPRTVSTVAGGASLVNIDSLAIHDRASSVAAQGIVGFSWKAADHLNVDLTYRYSGLDRIRLNTKTTGSVYGVFFNNTNGSGPGTVGPFVGRHLINQSATIGLRYAWGAAPR